MEADLSRGQLPQIGKDIADFPGTLRGFLAMKVTL